MSYPIQTDRTIVQRVDSAMNYSTFWLLGGSGFVLIIVIILWHIDFISTYSDDLRPLDTSNLSDVTKRLHKQIVFDFNTHFNSELRPVDSWVKKMFINERLNHNGDQSSKKEASTLTIPFICKKDVSDDFAACDIDANKSPTLVGIEEIASSIDSMMSTKVSVTFESTVVYHIAEDCFISEGEITVNDKSKGADGVKTVNTLTKYTLQRKTSLIKDIHVYVDRPQMLTFQQG